MSARKYCKLGTSSGRDLRALRDRSGSLDTGGLGGRIETATRTAGPRIAPLRRLWTYVRDDRPAGDLSPPATCRGSPVNGVADARLCHQASMQTKPPGLGFPGSGSQHNRSIVGV